MKLFPTKVLAVSDIAEKTVAVKLEKPEGFSFVAGQYSILFVSDLVEPDARGKGRCMSIASAPFEDHILFAMRLSESGYKKTIAKLSPGDSMSVGAPTGQCTFVPDDARPVVFLVGGIGITPARSMLRQADHDRDPREFFLFASNYRPEDTPFLEELSQFPNLRYHPVITMTEPERSARPWEGECGFITATLLEKYLPVEKTAPMYFIVGTPGFTKAMHDLLLRFAIPKEQVKQDPFVGL